MNDIERIVYGNGKTMQLIVAIEELAELQKELTKSLRGQENIDHIEEEMADVMLIIDELSYIFRITQDSLLDRVQQKIDRTLERMTDEHK